MKPNTAVDRSVSGYHNVKPSLRPQLGTLPNTGSSTAREMGGVITLAQLASPASSPEDKTPEFLPHQKSANAAASSITTKRARLIHGNTSVKKPSGIPIPTRRSSSGDSQRATTKVPAYQYFASSSPLQPPNGSPDLPTPPIDAPLPALLSMGGVDPVVDTTLQTVQGKFQSAGPYISATSGLLHDQASSSASTAIATAATFLSEHAGVPRDSLHVLSHKNLVVDHRHADSDGSEGHIIHFQQIHRGLPIVNAYAVVALDFQGTVAYYRSSLISATPVPAMASTTAAPNVFPSGEDSERVPRMGAMRSAQEVLKLALTKGLGLHEDEFEFIHIVSSADEVPTSAGTTSAHNATPAAAGSSDANDTAGTLKARLGRHLDPRDCRTAQITPTLAHERIHLCPAYYAITTQPPPTQPFSEADHPRQLTPIYVITIPLHTKKTYVIYANAVDDQIHLVTDTNVEFTMNPGVHLHKSPKATVYDLAVQENWFKDRHGGSGQIDPDVVDRRRMEAEEAATEILSRSLRMLAEADTANVLQLIQTGRGSDTYAERPVGTDDAKSFISTDNSDNDSTRNPGDELPLLDLSIWSNSSPNRVILEIPAHSGGVPHINMGLLAVDQYGIVDPARNAHIINHQLGYLLVDRLVGGAGSDDCTAPTSPLPVTTPPATGAQQAATSPPEAMTTPVHLYHRLTHLLSTGFTATSTSQLTGTAAAGRPRCLLTEEADQLARGYSRAFAALVTLKRGTTATDEAWLLPALHPQGWNGGAILVAATPTLFPLTLDSVIVDPNVPWGTSMAVLWSNVVYELAWQFIQEAGTSPQSSTDSADRDQVEAASVWRDTPEQNHGRTKFLRLWILALQLTPCQPQVFNVRDSLLAADKLLYSGAHRELIWKIMARRGLGDNAGWKSPHGFVKSTVAMSPPSSRHGSLRAQSL
ncbi:hypothetical protein IWQ60_001417 [Tieghemiomyces parasiticus]|uniref:Extracellular metalloproteinase n=1 Tax=Tieghemiomyces parasiticus TaxID=78921 RepID=A0A9W8AD35_9FUNG|nr:hypothetical protein IWQ60_001417 [Tieghemiomyces parasiticus]